MPDANSCSSRLRETASPEARLHRDLDAGVLVHEHAGQPLVGAQLLGAAVHRETQRHRARGGGRGGRCARRARVGAGVGPGRARGDQQEHRHDHRHQSVTRAARRSATSWVHPTSLRRWLSVTGPRYRDTPTEVTSSRSSQPYAGPEPPDSQDPDAEPCLRTPPGGPRGGRRRRRAAARRVRRPPVEQADARRRARRAAPRAALEHRPDVAVDGPVVPEHDESASPALTSPGPLLSAAELPGFNADYHWRPGGTTPREPSASFGTCQRFGLLAIGAERVVVRRYRPPADASTTHDRAGELVATFPDAATARRAYAVLDSWRARCADRLQRYRKRDVGAVRDVPVGSGQAGWYLLTYGPVTGDPDARLFDAQGAALVGSRIALVSLVLAGQDYDYPAGREPMATALQRAARKIS